MMRVLPTRLTLKEAIQRGMLSEFIAQEEARGVSDADQGAFDRTIRSAVELRRSEDRTSRFACGDGSTEK
jgi:hypothetical protein